MPTQTVFLKTTNLPEVKLVTIALSVSCALEKPWKFLKNETQKFYSGGVLSRGFLSWRLFVQEVFVGGFVYRGFCPRHNKHFSVLRRLSHQFYFPSLLKQKVSQLIKMKYNWNFQARNRQKMVTQEKLFVSVQIRKGKRFLAILLEKD